MNTEMTALDSRLYAWLGEPDEQRFERAFNSYFSIAFPAVLRHLARLSRWDLVQLEELAQDALLKFFDRAGRGRREAADEVSNALNWVRPLNLGPLHERQVTGWTADVSGFSRAAMSFRAPPVNETGGAPWKHTIRELAERIPLLQMQGQHLLRTVRLALHLHVDGRDLLEAAADEGSTAGAAPTEFESLASELSAQAARGLDAEKQHPGATHFVAGTVTVVRTIPRLRVPTNSYLFEIALTVYLDECRKRARHKRGGAIRTLQDPSPTAKIEDASQHPVELVDLEPEAASNGEPALDDAPGDAPEHSPTGSRLTASDPAVRYEDQEHLEKFYAYLRRPLEEATRACEQASARAAERRKLHTLTEKFSRTISVLSMLGEGYTQEQVAEGLDVSRNQVKYIVELVRAAYTRFAAPSTRTSDRHSPGGHSHVP